MKNKLFYLIRISKREYLEDLQKGNLYMNHISTFQQSEDNYLRQDKLEGADSIDQVTWIKLLDDSGNTMEFNNEQLKSAYVTSKPTEIDVSIFSFLAINKSLTSRTDRIDERNFEFGDFFMIVLNPPKLVQMFNKKAKELNLSNYWGTVNYYDRNNHIGELNLLSKPKEFNYQNEFRLIIENEKKAPVKINIGNISTFTEIHPIKMLRNLRFKTSSLTKEILLNHFNLKDTGREELDTWKNQIIERYTNWCLKINSSIIDSKLNNEGIEIQKDLLSFRYRMGYDKGAEFIESEYGWTKYFDEINSHINIIKSDA